MTMTEQTLKDLGNILKEAEHEKGRINEDDKKQALSIRYNKALKLLKNHFDYCME